MNQLSTISNQDILGFIEHIGNINLGYLTIAVSIVAFLGGAFYLFNVKPLKETLDRQEKRFSEARTEMLSSLEGFKKEISEDTSSTIKQLTEIITADTSARISALDKELLEKTGQNAKEKDESLKTVILSEMGNQIKTLEKTVTLSLVKNKDENNQESTSLKNEITNLKLSVIELMAFKYHSEGKMGGIIYQIDMLEEYSQRKPHLLSIVLKNFNEIVGKYYLNKDLSERLKKVLDKHRSGEHAQIVKEIEKNIKLEKSD